MKDKGNKKDQVGETIWVGMDKTEASHGGETYLSLNSDLIVYRNLGNIF